MDEHEKKADEILRTYLAPEFHEAWPYTIKMLREEFGKELRILAGEAQAWKNTGEAATECDRKAQAQAWKCRQALQKIRAIGKTHDSGDAYTMFVIADETLHP